MWWRTRITNLHAEHFPGVSSSIYLRPGMFSVKLFPESSFKNKHFCEERREPRSSRMTWGSAFWIFAPTSDSMFRYAPPNYNNLRISALGCGIAMCAIKGLLYWYDQNKGIAVRSYTHFTTVDTHMCKQQGLAYFITTLKLKLIIKIFGWIRIWFVLFLRLDSSNGGKQHRNSWN